MIVTTNESELAAWFAVHSDLPEPKPMRYIGCAVSGRLAFVVAYENFNGASMYIHVASDGASKVTRDFVWAVFDYPFNFCKAQMLIGPVASNNKEALRLTKHLGFKIEHVIEGAHPAGALVYMTMHREECRFLSPKWSRRALQQSKPLRAG